MFNLKAEGKTGDSKKWLIQFLPFQKQLGKVYNEIKVNVGFATCNRVKDQLMTRNKLVTR